jgi:hypothetical protein
MATTTTNAPARDVTQVRARSRWTGWAGFAGILMMVIGGLAFFEGLIAIIRDQYYVLTANQIIVFDLTTWGWITLVWGVVLVFAGLQLQSGKNWARWFTIVAASLNVFAQLGFVGSAQYPLWAIAIIALSVLVIFALIVHWDEARAD